MTNKFSFGNWSSTANGSFTFSAGLIDAYRIESGSARYPRVVIDPDVMDLIFPGSQLVPAYLIQEDDGLFFIDYIGLTKNHRPKTLTASINNVVGSLLASHQPSSVREKGLWLAHYSDSILETSLKLPKFSGKRVRTV